MEIKKKVLCEDKTLLGRFWRSIC